MCVHTCVYLKGLVSNWCPNMWRNVLLIIGSGGIHDNSAYQDDFWSVVLQVLPRPPFIL